ncbi:protein S-acyltransferase [Malassezia cuniculi]|uniref:Palmitoyltransferase n=1 Tax=Malassezia cuniculi TaxID=948313 RepID=A0AAF0JBU2_9BASI|nr:protein S-acyltransferase [Malassezia cuniculi]
MAAGKRRVRDEDDDLDEVRRTRGRVVTDGFDSDSDDSESGGHRVRWQKQHGEGAAGASAAAADEDDDDDMFASADKPEAEDSKKQPRSLKLSEIEGQEFGARTLAHSDDEDDDELDPEYAFAQSNNATEFQDANADAERTPPASPSSRDKRGMGYKIDGFNMKSELASGQFDQEGNYTWNAKDPYAQSDRWLEGNYSRKQMRAAQQAHEARAKRAQERANEQEAKYPTEAHALKALAEILEPGESVLEGLQAAGVSKRSKSGARGEQLELFTDLTAILMSDFGLMNIYDETYEGIVRKVRRAGIVDPEWDPKRTRERDQQEPVQQDAGQPDREATPSAAPPANSSVQYEYKWAPAYLAAMAAQSGGNVNPDVEIYGPYSATELCAWAKQGYFGAERENIRVRKHGENSWKTHLGACILILNVLGCYLLWLYWRCASSDAGSVPIGWAPDGALKASDISIEPQMRRYCQKCKGYKPPRSHHCSTCGRCVRRMDHHCQWVGNCVGQNNYADFYRFLVAVTFSCSVQFVIISLTVADYWNEDYYFKRPTTTEMVVIILNYLMCLPVILIIFFLAIYHTWLISGNTTTIEAWEVDRVHTQIRRGIIPHVRYPFDIGFWGNVTSVLGPNPLLWFVPGPVPGNGLEFPTSVADPAQYLWPPRDPRNRMAAPPEYTHGTAAHAMHPATTAAAVAEVPGYDSSGSDDEYEQSDMPPGRHVRVRRGSEGYEVRPPQYNREYWMRMEGYEASDWPEPQEPQEYPYGSFVAYGKYADMADDDEEATT